MDKSLGIKLQLDKIVESPNVAEHLTQTQLDALGKEVVDNYVKDRGTRSQWEQRSAEAIKLALQVKEHKNFPWENCSNVKFPLVTIAALQFLARISLMTKGRKLVKVDITGKDPEGKKAARAKRISDHMSLQLLESPVNWVDNDEQTKLATAIVGSGFKKSYNDRISGDNISEYVPSSNIVLDYFTKDVARANRITHVLYMDDNAIQERVRSKLFMEMLEGSSTGTMEANILQQTSDEVQGINRPAEGTQYEILEQHCWLDLDGDDYAEPYVVSVRRDTGQVLRIVARFFDEGDVHRVNDPKVRQLESALDDVKVKTPDDLDAQSRLEKQIKALEDARDNHIIRIDPMLYFTRYIFIPSPDGGVYGLGLGSLLGPVNESVDTLINQMVDAGTMSNTAGGFLGRGIKMKGGATSFAPFEWKTVDSAGDDMRKNLFPLPVREPSAVLFQLLGLLITYGEKISGATDIMTGVSPGQNTPAETSRNTVEQGMMLFSGIYARMYRAFRDEINKLYTLNRLYIESSPKFKEISSGEDAIIAPDDYRARGMRVFPAASPEAVSATQRKQKAAELLAIANQQPGFDKYLVTLGWLEASDYDDIDKIYPDPKGPNAIAPPQNPKVALEQAKLQQQAKEHQDSMQLAIVELQADIQVNEAKILELQAKATKALAEADGVKTGHQLALINAAIGAAHARQKGLIEALSLMQKAESEQSKLAMEGKTNGGDKSGQTRMEQPSSNA
ncbi:MAG: hypothetical protein KGM14_01550 [Actinomycetales bacterium]|nr:hypothetical protein [Actinomycetales bacterium]